MPTIIVDGERLETVGAGFDTEKVKALVVPPPGVGLVTETFRVPVADRSDVDNWIDNLVELIRVVVLAEPL